MEISGFQRLIENIYYERDSSRGLAGTHMWFCEEVGELTRALRRNEVDELEGEFADVLAWLATLASIAVAPGGTSRNSRRTSPGFNVISLQERCRSPGPSKRWGTTTTAVSLKAGALSPTGVPITWPT